MVWVDILLCVAAVLLAGISSFSLWRHECNIKAFSLRLREDAASLLELRYQEDWHRQLESAQDFTETVIDTSTATVRSVHMGIAKIPFDTLESFAATRDTTRIVRQTHDLISESVYTSIRGINKAAGYLTRAGIDMKARRIKPVLPPDEEK
ncbi:hypothetical protein [Zhongshania marina]|uniref:Uncharacterized protein n=1 Tax=Zhongshania marina TaxID=2304603 RepID=A0A2S4HBI3_9GAMM|nr:hypothetical protein [Marortus luteolus]POP51362.1 hypothetical protein C0068_17125 [Marortus luteolus]